MWGQVAAIAGGKVMDGQGGIKGNYEQQGQNKQIGWVKSNADTIAIPIGRTLGKGYAPGGWYRNLITSNQVADAETMRAREEPRRIELARRSGGIRSGAYANRRGGWANVLATAPMTGDLSGAQAGVGYDMARRYNRLQELSSEPVATNPYALYGNALQSLGQTWWNQGTNYTPTGQGQGLVSQDEGIYLPALYENDQATA